MLSDFTPDLSSLGAIWDPFPPAHHNGEYIAPGRLIAHFIGPQWTFIPETCQTGPFDTTWYLDGTLLLCNGCGLNVT
ncbi:hypothetical protein [Nocardia jejuensis]|uniref:hypothetical protein n=1 Tax=Nocardia jejuensis TaxID=328049 RepID=UPI00083207E2|nr:hypothetical protein [Nocardia jejuensis]